ncbi:thiosulfate oxidation carrier protein SoxY [Zoogloea sp.]|uniref:thiosulfate oxidation carrier protein SoxY n=1 Tax=Zoogloea sp. TaxID=49181 RepID=UPI001AD1908C|nr:thiosulfate oxidation carrier protein SoxY [Zoogloea sp.]MBN8284839.1 thiosulfate oxidation carrier protein SoxY [Zoogloea sp.]
MQRRDFLQAFGSAAALAPLVVAGLLSPTRALAVSFNRAAFEARTAADALRLIGAAGAETSRDIQLKAPEVAENGAAVPIEVASSIPGTTRLSILIDRNPLPLALQFNFAAEATARFQAKLRMAESSRLRVVATAGGKHYTVFREVKVTVGGCGD